MGKLKLPPVRRLHEALVYDPETGDFTWRWRPSSHWGNSGERAAAMNVRYAGSKAGYLNSAGYIAINFPWPILAHRIAWAMMTGSWSKLTIDHANTVRHDNRWCNLREATRLQQTWNRRVPRRHHLNLPRGVSFKGGKYYAYIGRNQKSNYLGYFNTIEEASAAYEAAAKKMQGKFFNSI